MEQAVEQHRLESKTFEVKMNQVLNENERLLEQVLSKDIVNIIVNSSVNNASVNVHECEKCLQLETELQTDFIEKEIYDKLFKSFTTLEKHCISLEVDSQLNQEIFQRDNPVSNQSAPSFDQLFELNELKAQSQEKDTVIKKLKERIKVLSGIKNEDKIKQELEEIETINIELDHRVTKLIAENEHLKQTYKQLYDSIKPARIRSKEHCDDLINQVNLKSVEIFDLNASLQEKVLVITALEDDLRKLKGKAIVDKDVTKHPSDQEMLKIDVEPITPKLLNKQTDHSAYIKHTPEKPIILRDLVEHVKSKYPLDQSLESACSGRDPKEQGKNVKFTKPVTSLGNTVTKTTSTSNLVSNKPMSSSTGVKSSTSANGSQPSGNTKKDKIRQTPSRTAHVQHSRLNANSELKCVKCNGCMLSANHDLCVLDFINNVNARNKSKSVKKNSKKKVWKPTGKVFTKIGYIWRPTGRTFTIVGNACPLTRITTTTEVPLRKPTALENETPKPVVTLVYSRKPRKSKTNVPDSKSKVPKSVSANKKEPSQSQGSKVSNVPSSSLNECRFMHALLGAQLAKMQCYLNEEKSQPSLIYKIVVDILKQTNFFRAFTASSTIPAIYIQQFWDTICFDSKAGSYKGQLGTHNHYQSVPYGKDFWNLQLRQGISAYKILWGVVNRAHIDYAERMWGMNLTQSIHTFTRRQRNFGTTYSGEGRKTRKSPLHLPTEELVLGNLKFSAKGTKREVFGMTIPNELVNDIIRGSDYYDAYLEKVAKHQESRAHKPKARNGPNSGVEAHAVSESSEAPPLAKRAKAGKGVKKRTVKSSKQLVDEFVDEGVPAAKPRLEDTEEAILQKVLEESITDVYPTQRVLFPLVSDEEMTSVVRKSGAQAKAGLDQTLITDASSQPQPEHMDEGFIATAYPEVQENLKLTVDEQMIPEETLEENQALEARLGKQGSRINKLETMDLPKMIKEQTVEFIDSQEIDRKINESVRMVWFLALVKASYESSSSWGETKKKSKQDSSKGLLWVLLHHHLLLHQFKALQGLSDHKRSINFCSSPPFHPLSHRLIREAVTRSRQSSSRQLLLLVILCSWTTTWTPGIFKPSNYKWIPDDLYMDDETTVDEQAYSSGEEVGRDHIPTVNLSWWKPLTEDRPATPEPAWTIPSFDLPIPTNNWASTLKIYICYLPPREYSITCFQTVISPTIYGIGIVNDNEISELTPKELGRLHMVVNVFPPDQATSLGGEPGHITIQSDFFFNKDLEYLRYGRKIGRPALSISKMKAAFYPDVGLEQLVPDQFGFCKRDRRAVLRTHMHILSVVRIEVFSMYGYNYMKKIILRRADLKEYVIAERDFKYMYPSDFEDLYLLNLQGHLNHLSPDDKRFSDYACQPILGLDEKLVIRQRLEEIDEALDYRVKEFRVNRTNPGMNTRFWMKKDVVRGKELMFTIQKRLKTRRIFRNLESFVGRRIREGATVYEENRMEVVVSLSVYVV
ncbi:hypothetical protein Tco_0038419 [Tanacetum coccineum]